MVVDQNGNRMFDEMLKTARIRLTGRDPQEISLRSGIKYEPESEKFHLKSLGEELWISYPEYEVTPKISEWHFLTILHYMDLSDGKVSADQIISFSQLKNGMIRGSGFDKRFEMEVEKLLTNQTEDNILAACRKLGGEIIESNADICAVCSYLPFYPLILKIWLADEEFPSTGRVFLNAAADHYLTVEDAVTAGEVFLEKMSCYMKKEQLSMHEVEKYK